MLLNRLVVYFYRYEKEALYCNEIVTLSKVLLKYVSHSEYNSFIDTLYSSVAYRGLSMVKEFDQDEQTEFLMKAEKLARLLRPSTKFEEIVASENIYTLLQTLAKWHINLNDNKKAETCLKEMIQIDPFDSTAYSELGFFYIRYNDYDKGAEYFKKAMELGPPGMGMNIYYYATCLEKLGNGLEAINYLYRSADIDKQALSPWLDLLNFYSEKKQFDKTKHISNHIFHTPILKEQLEEHEIVNIQTFLK